VEAMQGRDDENGEHSVQPDGHSRPALQPVDLEMMRRRLSDPDGAGGVGFARLELMLGTIMRRLAGTDRDGR
jgi:hypothetical protein